MSGQGREANDARNVEYLEGRGFILQTMGAFGFWTCPHDQPPLTSEDAESLEYLTNPDGPHGTVGPVHARIRHYNALNHAEVPQ